MQKCTKCGSQLPDGVKFCKNCGDDLSKQRAVVPNELSENVCQECGAVISGKAKFCKNCGADIRKQKRDVYVEPDKNICPRCGAKMAENTKFCKNCGAETGKKIVKAVQNAGKLINGIMEFTSQASDNPGEMVISNFKSKMKL